MYEYKCKVLKVVDGDTVDVDIDLGFGVWLRNERVRLYRIDAPESRTSDPVEKIFGLAAKDKLKSLLDFDTVILKTFSAKDGQDMKGKFGRILGDFYLDHYGVTQSVTQTMIDEGYAVPYYGQNKADIEVAHLGNRNRLMTEGVIDPKVVQQAQEKSK